MDNNKENSLVPKNNLYLESSELVDQIISENNPDKLEELTQLFQLNQKKKNIARINKLSQLLDIVDSEVENRLVDTPESFRNDELIKYMSTTQQAIDSLENNISNKPLIQINNQKNEININNDLNRESRQKVLEAVMSILNNENNIIDIDGGEDN